MTEPRVTDPRTTDPAGDDRSSSVGDATHRVANRVRDIMQTKLVTISVTDRLSTVEDIMTLGRVRHIPVVHGGKLIGVLSQRDLLRASLSELGSFGNEARRAFLHAIEIERVMSAPAITIGPEATVQLAARLMADQKIGCLPVIEAGELVGLVTETDVLGWVAAGHSDREAR